MQLTIKLPEILPDEISAQIIIQKIENIFVAEGVSYEISKESNQDDPWDSMDIAHIAVDTGIADFAENHDYYLYGAPKKL